MNDNILLELIHKINQDEGLVKHHIDSYDNYIINTIPQIFNNIHIEKEKIFGIVRKTTTIKFNNPYLSRPQFIEEDKTITYITPSESRIRNITYQAPLYVEVEKKVKKENLESGDTHEKTIREKVIIGWLPVMLHSSFCVLYGKKGKELSRLNECEYDQGGYFIVNGTEKVAIFPEIPIVNSFNVFSPTKGTIEAEIRTQIDFKFRKNKISYINKMFYMDLTQVKKPIPLFVLFRAFGIETNEDIVKYIIPKEDEDYSELSSYLLLSQEDAFNIKTKSEAIKWIGYHASMPQQNDEEKIGYAEYVINSCIFPHLELRMKPAYLGLIVKRLLDIICKKRDFDDRDHQSAKRYLTDGDIHASILKSSIVKMQEECMKFLDDKDKDGEKDFSIDTLISSVSKPIHSTISTGNYNGGGSNKAGLKTGVYQVLLRLSYIGSMSQSRRMASSINKGGTSAKPRLIHHSQYGRICPAETPEGQSAGITKNLSMLAKITIGFDDTIIIEYIRDIIKQKEIIPNIITKKDLEDKFPVFVNGKLIEYFGDINYLYSNLKTKKIVSGVPFAEMSVYIIDDSELHILTDAGRILRPLFIVENNKLKITLDQIKQIINGELHTSYLVDNGLVEYLDVNEEQNSLVCSKYDELSSRFYSYTHCEIHPSLILGASCSLIPFPDYNQSPRNCYQSNMGKQSKGVPFLNFSTRCDTMTHILHYPQRALVNPRNAELLNNNILPSTQNAIVAIIAGGYNQEDSTILNQSSIDRGFGRSTYLKTYSDSETKSSMNEEVFSKPNTKRYTKVDVDGFAPPGTKVEEKDDIICKVNTNEKVESRFSNTSIKYGEKCVIDKVILTSTKDNMKMVKVVTRSNRIPQMGDKVASRHGQKGTCGITIRQEDMPWTISGMTPDIIINPHAIPSRMTFGHMMEKYLGKAIAAGSETASKLDGTPFMTYKNTLLKDVPKLHDIIGECLTSCGFSPSGKEVMYSGATGKPLKAQIYLGPIAYQHLKHMVDDKIHARTKGQNVPLTRQPVEGRAREGGLRWGEMERDNFITVGGSSFLNERLFKLSDDYSTPTCKVCGVIGTIKENDDKKNVCLACGSTNSVVFEIPYAAKLLCHELMAMNIKMKLNF